MDIQPPSSHQSGVVPALSNNTKTGNNGQNSGRHVSATTPTLPQIPQRSDNTPANKPLQQRALSQANGDQQLPTVTTDSTDIGSLQDGQILIEAGDNPEAAATKTVDEIEKHHGKQAAGAAKKFFGAVLDFCKAHKNEMLGVAGFCIIAGAAAGGMIFPGAFLLVAPGMMLFAASMGGSLDPLPPPHQSPDATSLQSPDATSLQSPGAEKNKKTADENANKAPAKSEVHSKTPEPVYNDPISSELPKLGEDGDEEHIAQQQQLKNALKAKGVVPQITPVPMPQGTGLSHAMSRYLQSNHLVNSKLKEEDFAVFDKEQQIAALQNFTETEITAISAKYSKIAVGVNFFELDKVNKNDEYPAVKDIVPQEQLVLKQAYQRAAFEEAVKAVQEEKDSGGRIPIQQTALKAAKKVDNLIERLTPPASTQQQAVEKQKQFKQCIKQFLTDYSNSLDPKFVQASR